MTFRFLRLQRERELVDGAGEGKRGLVVGVVYAGSGIGAYVERFAGLKGERDGVRKCPASRLDAVNRDGSGSSLAEARTIVFEGELHLMFARRQGRAPFDLWSREVEQVVDEYRLSIPEVEPPAAETAARGHQHAVAAAGRHLYIGGYREGFVEDSRRRSQRHTDDRPGIGKLIAPGYDAGAGQNEAGQRCARQLLK